MPRGIDMRKTPNMTYKDIQKTIYKHLDDLQICPGLLCVCSLLGLMVPLAGHLALLR